MLASILDNDFYKFTMQNAVVNLFPRAKVHYQFINRGEDRFPKGFGARLEKNIKKMARLKLTAGESEYIKKKCIYLGPAYIDFLKGYRYDPDEVSVCQENSKIKVTIKGYWYRTILWEVPILSIISELYFKVTGQKTYSEDKIVQIVKDKALRYNRLGVKFADFGTRRRYSYKNHDLVINALLQYGHPSFIGSSNVHLAMIYNLSPIGTHAHEWFMFHSAKFGYKMANRLSLEHWTDVYGGDLGIALSDTFTSDIFYKDFDKKFAKLFDGVRHDSGDPFKFVDKTIAHYVRLNIDPKFKIIIFSDALTPDKVEAIAEYCKDKIKIAFGIGTNFSNDVGVEPLNIVIKMTKAKPEGCQWVPTIKLSDTIGKYTGAAKQIQLCKNVLDIENS